MKTHLSMRDAFALAANRVCPSKTPSRTDKRLAGLPGRTPGTVLVRVRVRAPGGKARDRNEARESLRQYPWFASVRYLCTRGPFHLFERPE